MVFECINIRQVPWEVLKTAAFGLGFQHLPRTLPGGASSTVQLFRQRLALPFTLNIDGMGVTAAVTQTYIVKLLVVLAAGYIGHLLFATYIRDLYHFVHQSKTKCALYSTVDFINKRARLYHMLFSAFQYSVYPCV